MSGDQELQNSSLQVDLGFRPRTWQQKCDNERKKYTVLVVHRRAGKTVYAAHTLFAYALQRPGMYAYVMPELKQGRFVAWPVFKSILQKLKGVRVSAGGKNSTVDLATAYESDNTVRFINGSEIKLLGSDNPDSIRGAKLRGVVLDEVAQMPREVWTEVIMPALLDSDGWAIFIGTPKGVNLFSELYDKGKNPDFPNWTSLLFTVYETEALSSEQIEDYRSVCSEEEFKREMLCDFTASTEDQLISLADVNEAMERYKELGCTPHDLPEPYENCILGVDVSRYGNDRSVIFKRVGLRADMVTCFSGKDTAQLVDAVKKAYERYKPSAIYVDGTGVGGGVVDMLRSRHIPCYDVNFSSSSSEAIYNNKRTEIWCQMAQWVKNKGCLDPKTVELKTDLPAPLYTRSENGTYALESKKEIRKRLGLSPDLGDALALTFTNYVPDYEVDDSDCVEQEPRLIKRARYTPFDQFERDINAQTNTVSDFQRFPAFIASRMGRGF